MSKMVKLVDDCKDIKLSIHESVSELKEEYDFEGWTRGISDSAYAQLSEQNALLLKENSDLKERLKTESSTQKVLEDSKEFWEKEYILIVHGTREFMGNEYRSQIKITMNDIFTNMAPLMMVPTKTPKLKSDFEAILGEKHFPGCYSLYLQDNQFQNIKVQIYSLNLITLDTDKAGSETISLSEKGLATLCNLNN